MIAVQIKLYDLFRKELKLSDEKALEFVGAVEDIAVGKADKLADKEFVKDEIHRLEIQMYKAMFWSGMVQLLAILGGVFAIVKFFQH